MQEIVIKLSNEKDYKAEESYKNLRTNIQLCGNDIKSILFTSCSPDEGKSSVSFNIAKSMADGNKKVLFVDADLRKSVLAGRYRVNTQIKGLAHYLSGQCKLEDIICTTNIDRLNMIFAGVVPPNPAELLDGKLFRTIVEVFGNHYDYVIIDTPPIGSVIDAAIVAQAADAAVLVIGAGDVSYRFAQDALNQLKKTDCKILGAVLNKVDMSEKGYGKYYGRYYGRYYGKYYGNYGEYGNEKKKTR